MATTGVPAMLRQLTTLGARANLVTAIAGPAIVKDIEASVAARFTRRGPGWVPLAASTVAEKTRLGVSDPTQPLDRTGALRKSLTDGSNSNAVVRITPDEVYRATKDPKAGYHQQGGTKSRTRLPARPMVVVREADALRWSRYLQRALTAKPGTAAAAALLATTIHD